MDLSAAFPTFIVTLREGFEAALVVGIVVACLQKAQQTQLYRWVYFGVVGGILASIGVGIILANTLQGLTAASGIYAPLIKQILAAGFGVIAIAMLSWMLLWMSKQARSMKGEMQSAIDNALNNQNAGAGIFLLVFIAVLREGFETVLFILAKFQESWLLPITGAAAGLIVAGVMGWLLFAIGIKINVRLFFQIMGVFLLLIVGGLVLSAAYHFDQFALLLSELSNNNWCFGNSSSCLLGIQIWDGSIILPDQTFPGIVLKALFGYRQTLYLLQIIVYLTFLLVVGTSYWNQLKIKN
ncbi:high-affinity Fe2+/Pb2+ permease [Xenococcus sp. PCC 7305]|uniref:FTR1 family iron permease n=1 Tax=Xenococcus sp. PCC 7305 TaxID=102125 RepID=UPI0002ABB462|nr:FTR1 family protein [Xenococcus sp. PCC 7305]ELS01519.1 high-affinity Fe2+/Pb2+ permease [Xenococcus sp. PCC 7305]